MDDAQQFGSRNAADSAIGASAVEPTSTVLDPDLCYRALSSRDARFDGRFFVGVQTTGVFCRPVCPARRPKRENVRFFACAAAAAEAGFRPCLRCRPEASPGTPAWLGTSATVSRALRMIASGALDSGTVDELAGRLGLGERHLRRLFLQHLGAAPIAVAQTRRVLFAKKLIDETDLPMTRVAFDSGFASVRRFNAAIGKTYGRCPRELRRRHSRVPGDADHLRLRLPYREPFDWQLLLAFLSKRAISGVEQVDCAGYRRTVAVGDRAGILALERASAGQPSLLLTVPIGLSPDLVAIVERARRMFDLGADPNEIDGHLATDPLLGRRIARRPGLRVPGAWDSFETAVRAIVGQQVTVAAATTIMGRIATTCGTALETPRGELTRLFPAPSALAGAPIAGLGVPRARAAAISALARCLVEGRITLDGSLEHDQIVRKLTALPGIGPWTAEYIAMRALGEPDAFPPGDVGILRALGGSARRPTASDVARRTRAWRPWRAYAAMYLWTLDAGGKAGSRNGG
jgi:AraC family transcriptional regulator of adaptative response / DNA-3-methyladenine glycosylase II